MSKSSQSGDSPFQLLRFIHWIAYAHLIDRNCDGVPPQLWPRAIIRSFVRVGTSGESPKRPQIELPASTREVCFSIAPRR